jgi:molybdate transport system substrate-binding protein
MSRALLALGFVLGACAAALALAGDVDVAVAANFAAPMQAIADKFAAATGHRARLAIGSTGKLYAQIENGAPFKVLLGADAETAAKLESQGRAVAGTRFTYATGRLVLWSRDPALVDARGAVLHRGGFERLALADPRLAPYGRAAVEVLQELKLKSTLTPRFVVGQNIAQAYQFVATGNAPLGFVALSQVQREGRIDAGSAWIVPARLHAPIRQDAVLLSAGRDSAAARALLAYLRGAEARRIIRSYGYE